MTLLFYGPGGDDDTHISYTVALHLAETGNIVNHSGEAVEQGSSLLHVVSLAAAFKVINTLWSSLKLTDIGPLFSLFAAFLCLPIMLSLAKRCQIRSRHYLLSLLLLSVSFSYWAIGGLESTLTSLCLLCLALTVTDGFSRRNSNALLAYCPIFMSCILVITVRPEGYFIIIAFLLALQVLILLQKASEVQDKSFCLKIFCFSTVVFVALCLWRDNYFMQWFPQPVYAKAEGISLDKIAFGFLYFIYSMQLSIIIYTLMLLSLLILIFFKAQQFEFTVLVIISLSCSYLAFIVASGGDWMTGGRFFTPVIPLLILLCLKLLESFSIKPIFWGLLLLLAAFETLFFGLNFSTGENILLDEKEGFRGQKTDFNRSMISHGDRYSWSEKHNILHLRDMATTNALIDIVSAMQADDHYKNKRINISSIQMGMIPYHLSRTFSSSVRLIDLRGLSSLEVTSCAFFDDSARNWLGVKASYPKYFAAIESGDCPQLQWPDIIYDLSNLAPRDRDLRLKAITSKGYRIVYQQQGFLQNAVANKSFDAAMFIAVSEQAYTLLPLHLRDKRLQF